MFDIAQTDGVPVPEVVPVRLKGEGPAGLWEALAEQVATDGYELQRGRCARPQANGSTDPGSKIVTVRDDVSPAQACKTLVHERAHILLGHVENLATYQICRGPCEVEAESADGRFPASMSRIKIQGPPGGCWCRPARKAGGNECLDHGWAFGMSG